MQNVAIGIDPGVTRTGVVLLAEEPVAWATFHSTGKVFAAYPVLLRCIDLSTAIVEWLQDTMPAYKCQGIGIEHPIYGRNPKIFALQMRLYQQLVSDILNGLPNCTEVREVNPKTVKLIGAGIGGAKKEDMVRSSSFAHCNLGQEDKEALADAEAIAKCVFAGSGERVSVLSTDDYAALMVPATEGRV